jgi:hypothetical protein
MNKIKKTLLLALAGAGIASGLSACSVGATYTDPSMVALRYAGGPTEGGKFKECVEPGTKQISNDSYFNYPTTQREDVWDADNANGHGSNSADHVDLQVSDKDGNVAYLKVKVSFYLNTDCDVLREFHEKIGRTRHAYFDSDGKYGDGWIWSMDNYISSAATERAKAAAIKYSVEDMWLKPDVRDAMAKSIQESIQKSVDDGMEGDEQFYKDFNVRVFGASPDPEFTALYKERKAAQVKADTAEANKKAKIAEAQADAAVAQEQAKIRRAEIDGYGDVNAYIKAQMVQKGLNPYQPTYGGTVAAPAR